MNIRNIVGLLVFAVLFTACEYFDAPTETLHVQTGEILFPNITLNGAQYETLVAGSITSYSDEGVVATLGAEDISTMVEVTGTVDVNTPGVYSLVYSVSTINSLDQASTVSASRFVNITSEDLSGTDLSGSYLGTGFSGAPTPKAITKVATGWYRCPDVIGSGNNIVAIFAHTGGNGIVIPDQPGPFGNVNTTAAGTSATLTATGFNWTVFISCCGNFGPITWTKQ